MNKSWPTMMSSRYLSITGYILDQMSYWIAYPWATLLCQCLAYYIPTTHPQSWFYSVVEKLIYGPCCYALFLAFFPVGFSALALWFFVSSVFPSKKFSYQSSSSQSKVLAVKKETFTLASANVLLANEAYCRFNNKKNPLLSSQLIGYKLMFQSGGPIENMRDKNSDMKDCVITDLPDIDVLCLQQVWERYWASNLIAQLKMKYAHFIYDVGDFSLGSNFCLFGSGLFVASKYPVEAADFQTFHCRTGYARLFSYGVLCLKLRISSSDVAYVANVHLQQGVSSSDTIAYHQLSECLSTVNAFQLKHRQVDDCVIFDSICGDFNFDNVSSARAAAQRHPLFHQFPDFCSLEPGCDRSWTIGTQMRQGKMHETAVSNPQHFRNVLVDDFQRSNYIYDADVVQQTAVDPARQSQIDAASWRGKRRTDRILLRDDSSAQVVGYAFSTVLAGLTDHVPVVMSVQTKSS